MPSATEDTDAADGDGVHESDLDDEEEEDIDAEEAAAMVAEAENFVLGTIPSRRSSGGGVGNGSGNSETKAAEESKAAAATAARLEEAANVLSASLGSQHPQVGKAWLLVARAHGAGSGGGCGGGGGERALAKCVPLYVFPFFYFSPSLSLSLSLSLAHELSFRIFSKKKKTGRTRSARTTSLPSPMAAAPLLYPAARRRRSARSGKKTKPLLSLPRHLPTENSISISSK